MQFFVHTFNKYYHLYFIEMAEDIIMEVEMRKKGQVTIPSEVRHILNLKEGHKMILIVNNNEIILVPKVLDPMNNIGILGEEEETFGFREKLDHYKSGA